MSPFIYPTISSSQNVTSCPINPTSPSKHPNTKAAKTIHSISSTDNPSISATTQIISPANIRIISSSKYSTLSSLDPTISPTQTQAIAWHDTVHVQQTSGNVINVFVLCVILWVIGFCKLILNL
eukprot:347047_1